MRITISFPFVVQRGWVRLLGRSKTGLLLIVEFRNIAFGDFSHIHIHCFVALFLVMPFFVLVFIVFLGGCNYCLQKKLVLPSLLLTFVIYGGGRLGFIGVGVLGSLWGCYVVAELEVLLTMDISSGEAGRGMGRQLSVYPLHYVFYPLILLLAVTFFTYSSCGYVDMGFVYFLPGVLFIYIISFFPSVFVMKG
ncbi:hypothetical protein BDD12DRAFT_46900 [Trichophaea hybrida]|nr:hypothetical protein BDD12DRAFT_46900 [Trichophaea hybrida]